MTTAPNPKRTSRRAKPLQPVAEAQPPAPPIPEVEKDRIREWKARSNAKPAAPKVKVEQTGPKQVKMEMDHPNGVGVGSVALMTAAGTTDAIFANRLLLEILNALPMNDGKVNQDAVNGALAGLAGIAPTDETEAMLAAQMVTTHVAAMDMLRLCHGTGNVAHMAQVGGLAVKLMRTYTAQMEALNRHRGKGQQKVTVEHVHVHEGGQAIVGAVNGPGGSGGGR